jgi:hypothetical protein
VDDPAKGRRRAGGVWYFRKDERIGARERLYYLVTPEPVRRA